MQRVLQADGLGVWGRGAVGVEGEEAVEGWCLRCHCFGDCLGEALEEFGDDVRRRQEAACGQDDYVFPGSERSREVGDYIFMLVHVRSRRLSCDAHHDLTQLQHGPGVREQHHVDLIHPHHKTRTLKV